ncbi:MAG TPA: VCBS repeat-containing protein, partial [Planctomycetota bacterium]|nr:VCBS repeat-containing protein [Planctomycetota bacterium]
MSFVDTQGHLISSVTQTVTVALATNPGGATLSGALAVAASGGVARFTDLSLDRSAAGYALSAVASGFASATSATFDVAAGPAAHLAFTTGPGTVAAHQAISPAVRVTLTDALGNVATGAATPVTVALGPNPPAAGTLSGTRSVAPQAGVATFADLSIDAPAHGYTLVASSGALPAATSAAFDVSPGQPVGLAFSTQPGNVTAGAVLAPVAVSIVDAFGNAVASAAGAVSLRISTNPAGGALTGTLTVSATAGVARFSNLRIDRPGAGYVLSATTPALGTFASAPFDVVAAPAVGLAFRAGPRLAAANVAFSPPVEVAVVDAAGSVVPGASAPVSLSIGTDPTGHATLAGTLTVTPSAGIARFPDLSVDATGAGFRLAASAPGLAGALGAPLDVAASAFDPGLPRLDAVRILPAGSQPNFGSCADLDGDGNLDLAIANRASNTISIEYGRGDGGFEPKVDIAAGATPWDVSAGDVDGDGRLDLAVANQGANTVTILARDAANPRLYSLATTLTTGNQPADAKLVDLDADGRLDLVVVDRGANEVLVFLQHPTLRGVFLAAVSYAVG